MGAEVSKRRNVPIALALSAWVIVIALFVTLVSLNHWRLVSDAIPPLSRELGRAGAEGVSVAVFVAFVVTMIAAIVISRWAARPNRIDREPYRGHWLSP